MKKFNYYKHLRSLGISEEHAIAMTEQATTRKEEPNAYYAVLGFARWTDTKEGVTFWDKLTASCYAYE